MADPGDWRLGGSATGLRSSWDAVAFSRVDDHTYIGSRMKAGKLVGIETLVLSPDGKTPTTSVTGDAPGGRQQVNSVAVYDKQ